jgi:acyl-CoA reductase-like NAD-dependent aldehyde dehydrogenase
MLRLVDARTGETIGHAIPETSPAILDQVVAGAHAASGSWRHGRGAARAALLEA